MMSLTLLSLMNSALYLLSSHPVALTALILTQALMVCASAWATLKVSWFSYILFLIFLGGLMVLFIYITSLASNETMRPSLRPEALLAPPTLIFIWGSAFGSSAPAAHHSEAQSCLTALFSLQTSMLISGVMLYLFLTLVVVVKTTSSLKAPLKNFIF